MNKVKHFTKGFFILICIIFGCDSSPRSPNVSMCVCVYVTLATTVLDFCRTSQQHLEDF